MSMCVHASTLPSQFGKSRNWLQSAVCFLLTGYRFENFQVIEVENIQSWRPIDSPNCQDGVLLTLSYGAPLNTFLLYEYNYGEDLFEALNHTGHFVNGTSYAFRASDNRLFAGVSGPYFTNYVKMFEIYYTTKKVPDPIAIQGRQQRRRHYDIVDSLNALDSDVIHAQQLLADSIRLSGDRIIYGTKFFPKLIVNGSLDVDTIKRHQGGGGWGQRYVDLTPCNLCLMTVRCPCSDMSLTCTHIGLPPPISFLRQSASSANQLPPPISFLRQSASSATSASSTNQLPPPISFLQQSASSTNQLPPPISFLRQSASSANQLPPPISFLHQSASSANQLLRQSASSINQLPPPISFLHQSASSANQLPPPISFLRQSASSANQLPPPISFLRQSASSINQLPPPISFLHQSASPTTQ
ncbi:zinc finger protein [Apostichopus japonicus]|uniref:Zinc finger protein n=1 Tax=Stichopus japonicus TaxID=307972 RepID=A0A2G8LB96_STIJA|nr:zinc finger protein [Apostichopus japonicus]